MTQQQNRQNWLGNETGKSEMQRAQSGNLPAYPGTYFAPLSSFFTEVDRMFENAFRSWPAATGMANMGGMMGFHPNIDITSNDNEYTVTAEMPGLDEKDLSLEATPDGTLIIRGEKRRASEDKRGSYEWRECAYGSFQRMLTLPQDVDPEKIEADFRNGLLTIHCPRSASAKERSRQIPVGKGRSEQRGAHAGQDNRQQDNKKAA